MIIFIIFSIFIFLISCLFRFLGGPFFYGNNSDPSYFYLFNFYNINIGKSPEFIDHPGATLDVLGAGVMKSLFLFKSNITFGQVIPIAETLLGLVWLLMQLFYIGTLVILANYTYRKSQDKIFTFLVLLNSLWLIIVPSFRSLSVQPISANVNSDTMMMVAVNLMLITVIRFYFSQKQGSFSHPLFMGLAVAFAVATKFTALPYLGVAFFLLINWRQRTMFIVLFVSAFLVFIYPIWGEHEHIFSWVKGLVVAKGFHGTGGEGFNLDGYLINMMWVIQKHWFFVVLWVAAIVVGIKKSRVLVALGIGGILQMIMVAKQPSYQYMAPMIGLSSVVLAIAYRICPELCLKGLKWIVVFITILSLILIGSRMYYLRQTTQQTQDILKVINTQYASCMICPFYRSSTMGFSFVFWNRVLKRKDFSQEMKKQYPKFFYYDIFYSEFKTSDEKLVSFNMLHQANSCVLLYGSDGDPKKFEPWVVAKKVYTNEGSEALYEVISARSKKGMEFLKYALLMSSQNNYKEALQAAMVSQNLGCGEDLSKFINILKQQIQGK